MVSTDKNKIDEVLTRSINTIYPSKRELEKRLLSGEKLTFYMGIDPTADYVHLGHSTNYLILERLHNLGHKIIVLVGDFTAMIGDPSDKNSMRTQLSAEQVNKNLETFKIQIGKILNFDDKENPIEFRFNSKWLAKFTFKDAVELASNFTVQQMIERDAFKKRLNEQKPLYVHEFFYPLMQGYDSVALNTDCEIGGTDQTFNMLAGRVLLKRYKDKEKFVITTTLLENPETGEKLMSKSLGTGIGVNERSEDMFVKIMKFPDCTIRQLFIDCTRLPMLEVERYITKMNNGENPRDIKLILAHEIVKMYHGEKAADDARDFWLSTISEKTNQNTIELLVSDVCQIEAIAATAASVSKSQLRRLAKQGAVRLNGKKVSDLSREDFCSGDVLSIGKKNNFKLNLN